MTALALALATTIKHDGYGGIADLLSTPEEATTWLVDHEHLVTHLLGPTHPAARGSGRFVRPDRPEIVPDRPDTVLHGELLRMRRAVRALFARAVAPGPPSTADADRLMDVDSALRLVNRAARRLGTRELEWPDGGAPVTRRVSRTQDPVELLIGAIGRSTIDFLTGPDRERLRACPAARCVKYFLQDDPRQTWCSPACGNRERVNRHYRKRTAG
ncbi:CGNR zinc finger domain-containing protein [Kribbella shirazensis]|uniref:Putative RNA-binding Zn ribbon-like protein n=1 Tax=Kribbella shirazensis TaxID=1105143 RepID=A0A7X5V9M4_9ACTN|nr:ABATE domain-containing protein [Kribbella shirazensis]NIK57189.1 putative RNA-binding Zn ribbon-like protein [Kribbella shirazensis]